MNAAVRAFAAVLALSVSALPAVAQDAIAKNVAVKSVETAAANLAPGIDASFFFADFKTIEQMASYVARAKSSRRVALTKLEASDPTGQIFDAGTHQLYGLRMVGFLKFPEAGDWKLTVNSNDGVRIKIADQLILEDPAIHSDRRSPDATVKVPAAGLVPIEVLYFQRKGSATLELYWTPPGKSEAVIVPAEAFWHKKS